MSAPIAPGDWVEVVEISGMGLRHGFVLGGVYMVEDVRPADDGGLAGLVIKDHPSPHSTRAWADDGSFRPIYRPSSKLIEQLSQPVEIPADAPVSVPA